MKTAIDAATTELQPPTITTAMKRLSSARSFTSSMVASVLLFTGCSSRHEPPIATNQTPPLPVRAVSVEWSDAAVPVFADGVLRRRVESALSFKIDGMIRTVAVREGDEVARGELIAALDLAEIDAEVTRARAALEKVRRDLGRVERLRAQNVATLEQVQDATTAVELAEAALQAAEFNQRFATITAPSDGVILRRRAEPDELVKAGTPIVHFAASHSPWIVQVGLAEKELAGISIGGKAMVALTGRGRVDAEVTHLAGMLDPTTRTLPVELELRDPPDGLRSGFVARVQLEPRRVPPRPVVPLESLVAGDRLTAVVFLVETRNGSPAAKRVPVAIESLYDGVAYLSTALPEKALLVTSGAEFLTDEARVSISP